jgi:hypothetical protein
MARHLARIATTLFFMAFSALPLAAIELIMVEQPGCAYCAAWDDKIAPIYPKTQAGQFAPLRRVQIDDPAPQGVTYTRPARFTPTFILINDAGAEVGRIEGYPGEDFFWGLLEMMLADKLGFQDRPLTQ